MTKPNDLILVLDFGGQYNQLIARRVRDLGVYSELHPYNISVDKIKEMKPIGIILSGGPKSVYVENAPVVDSKIYDIGIPILGICYGMQLLTHQLKGNVGSADIKEYGKAMIKINNASKLFVGLKEEQQVWMSHSDLVNEVPVGFTVDASTNSAPIAALSNEGKKIYGVQFHPEVQHTTCGNDILKNFLFNICDAKHNWSMESFLKDKIEEIRKTVGDKKVLCALSGGVDSAVVAVLIHEAIGDQLTCMFIDHGLLRKNEADSVMATFAEKFKIKVVKIDAKERFLTKLKDIKDPEQKRKIIGNEFIYLFEEESKKIGDFDFLAQGTLYTDIIESGTNTAETIKSHHNVGGLPEDMNFKLIEPLNMLFKDEVRKAGSELGIPNEVVWRQPFPGPGLAIRILGDITENKLNIVRESDFILRDEIKKANLERDLWQYFTVLLDIRSVGVMGDIRTYAYTIAIRAVTSIDGMTADWARIPYDVLEKISNRIVNEVAGINRVVLDITSKPPSTIEWE